MTSPRKRVPANRGQKKSRRRLGIRIGFMMAVVGTVLFLLNYSTGPGLTYTGMVIGSLGVVIMIISALMQDRMHNGNSHR